MVAHANLHLHVGKDLHKEVNNSAMDAYDSL